MAGKVYANLTNSELIKITLERGEGVLASNGALNVLTGDRTGRSPKDRFIIKDSLTEKTVDWGIVNQPYSPDDFEKLWQDAIESLHQMGIFQSVCWVGANPKYRVSVKVECNLAWHTLFCNTLFIKPDKEEQSAEWHLVNASNFQVDGVKYNLPGTAAIILDFSKKRILICGTRYAGEMKKAMFSVLNYLYPEKDILPMHCAANRSKEGNVTLFFGLSGTGKTTLSADPDRLLIGDDEHGWGDDGVFNFEGGCYAKCINLSEVNEPLIWQALRSGAVMENVVLDKDTNIPDFADDSLTENTRAAYPLSFIKQRAQESVHPQPKHVVFLTCDLYGVLPPVAKLTHDQVIYYFLSGYTALVGSTEVGHGKGIKPTFSQCFGAPFFSRHPKVYADLLVDKLKKTGASVFLVNTGWYGGMYGKGGSRFPIKVTRQIISSITNGKLDNSPYEELQPFGLHVPTYVEGIDSHLLYPNKTWENKPDYHEKALYLMTLFEDNYKAKEYG